MVGTGSGWALVAGAGGGIGAAVAQELSDAGWSVECWDIDERALIDIKSKMPPGTRFAAVDATDHAAVTDAVLATQEEIGGFDVVVNVIGWTESHRFESEDPAYWRKVMAINLDSLFNITHAVWPAMVSRNGGRIIAFASDAGRVGQSGQAVYSAAKGGVIAFVKAVAREGARYGITANVVSPGPTATPLLDQQDPATLERVIKQIPLRRFARPEEQAAAVEFLASPRSAMITGQTISVSGGLTMV